MMSTDFLIDIRKSRYKHAKRNTVPQIYVGYRTEPQSEGYRVGGFDDLSRELEDGTFQRRLGGIMPTPVVKPAAAAKASLAVVDVPDSGSRGAYLNTPLSSSSTGPVTALALSQDLQRRALHLTDKFATADGARVDYKAMRTSDTFAQVCPPAPAHRDVVRNSAHLAHECVLQYCAVAAQLQSISFGSLVALPAPARLAFFVNLYNAMVLHATCVLGPPEVRHPASCSCKHVHRMTLVLRAQDSPDARAAFFSGRTGAVYVVDGRMFSLDDVEHGIIRANQPHPSQVAADPTAGALSPVWEDRHAFLHLS
jgi:hypothetical protein